jgi:hypothetical protein
MWRGFTPKRAWLKVVLALPAWAVLALPARLTPIPSAKPFRPKYDFCTRWITRGINLLIQENPAPKTMSD